MSHLQLRAGPVPGPRLPRQLDAGQDTLQVPVEVERPLVESGDCEDGSVTHVGASLLSSASVTILRSAELTKSRKCLVNIHGQSHNTDTPSLSFYSKCWLSLAAGLTYPIIEELPEFEISSELYLVSVQCCGPSHIARGNSLSL